MRKIKVAVVYPTTEDAFNALKFFSDMKLCHFVLIGPEAFLQTQAEKIKLTDYQIISAENHHQSSLTAVKLAHEKVVDLLMKGSVSTGILLKAVLDKNDGLRSGKLLSHLIVFETSKDKFLGLTDGGINTQPSLDDKVNIINNAVQFFHCLGVKKPKVAILSAIEKVNPRILGSNDAVILIEKANAGDIKNAAVYGPVAFDLAVSQKVREIKGVSDQIPYDADIILVPEIVCGNSLAKSLTYCAKLHSGGVVLGAQCPIILPSRADSAQERLYSILLGIMQCILS